MSDVGYRPTYSTDLLPLLISSTLLAGGSVSCDIPLSAYRTDAKFSLAIGVSGLGGLKVQVLTQSLPNGPYIESSSGSEIVTGYKAADGSKVFDFRLPVSRSARFVFTEDGGAEGIELETASLCLV